LTFDFFPSIFVHAILILQPVFTLNFTTCCHVCNIQSINQSINQSIDQPLKLK